MPNPRAIGTGAEQNSGIMSFTVDDIYLKHFDSPESCLIAMWKAIDKIWSEHSTLLQKSIFYQTQSVTLEVFYNMTR